MAFKPLIRPIRIVLRWQLIATAALTLVARGEAPLGGTCMPGSVVRAPRSRTRFIQSSLTDLSNILEKIAGLA